MYERKQYIDEYYEKEGIRLDETKITVNEGLRSISKFLLNSMWGRYRMQTNKTKFKWISSVVELYQMLLAENLIIMSMRLQCFTLKSNNCILGRMTII